VRLVALDPGDAPRLAAARAFLAEDLAGAMFPLAAIHAGRLTRPGAPLAHPYALHAWVAEGARGIEGFVGANGDGMLVPRWPGPVLPEARHALGKALAGVPITGLVGPASDARAILGALGLDRTPRRTDGVEPGYALDLDALAMPDTAGLALRPIEDGDTGQVEAWRTDYLRELQHLGTAEAATRAARDVAAWRAAGTHRILWRGTAPAALTGFNATLPGVVQVGAVFVPPPTRNRGLGRRAVALHLAEARAAGTRKAVLFAAGPAAERAYRALGFQRAGDMAVIEFQAPAKVAGPGGPA